MTPKRRYEVQRVSWFGDRCTPPEPSLLDPEPANAGPWVPFYSDSHYCYWRRSVEVAQAEPMTSEDET